MRRALIGLAVIAVFATLQAQMTEQKPSAITHHTWTDNTPVVTSDTMILTSVQTKIREWRSKECRFQGVDHNHWTLHEIKLTLKCAVEKWSVPGGFDKALDIAQCESGPDLRDPGDPPEDMYIGTFQQSLRYWGDRLERHTPKKWEHRLAEGGNNPRSNIVVSIRMAHADNGWYDWSMGACA